MDEVEVGEELLVEPDSWQESENGAGTEEPSTLLTRDEAIEYRTRWETVQAGFIDEPRRTVEQADDLVDRVLKRLSEGLTAERDRLVRRWDQTGDPVTTEDLRLALQGYRGLLERLLSASL
ncbi:MAG: hypothetical protein ACE5HP_11040 [Gemmatimonadota bacterium]